ncbi:SDR family oxidoreductase [Roseomonas terrae]|jgi:nucleoside-diphosphate-sugar epimerase|uniref:SDR family oxidoreductase n=1 Tax=Neoroseomonas terrae TaxID=424799 RepID=A0ABS5EBF8_9PROT|nr:SDR family oxidoreductase [Neoroseomonas terrae]MBR0648356.1 SDR family oxidoreductase [Neoroseomonas terrae]
MNRPTLLIAGASGAAAARLMDQAQAGDAFRVIGLSRRRPEKAGDWVEADLTDASGLARALSSQPDITHIVYASRAPHGETGLEDVAANVAMLRNLLDAAEASLPHFAHLHVIHGAKWYGVHLGPCRTPAREDDPRHMPPNFYYDQQDLLAARQAGKAWSWSASRPNFVLDVAPGRARNIISTLGAYAAICRELGVPFDFPGKPGAWNALHEVTDAALLAQGVLWMIREPRCANRAFNMTNGDAFRWCDLWAFLADRFNVPLGRPRPMAMRRLMADKEPVWERVRARHGLALPLAQVASWDFADFFLNMDYDVLISMTAARNAGFPGFVDSWAMFDRQIDGYRAARVLPPG